MNLIDPLSFLQFKKSHMSRESLSLLVFSFLITILLFMVVGSTFYIAGPRITASNSPLNIPYKILNNYSDIFVYTGAILIFLMAYLFGSIINREICWPFIKRRKFIIKGEDLRHEDILDLFDFQGVVRNKFEGENCLYLNYSSDGLLTKKGFRNFDLIFKAKVLLHGFGVILCAKDLENYVMLRVNVSEEGLHITPHIRRDGIWEIQDIKDEKENKSKIELGKMFNFQVAVKGRIIELVIKDEEFKVVREFTYLVPNRFPLLPTRESEDTPKGIVSKLDFPIFGKIGFRVYGPDEKAIIYDIEITE